MRPIRDRLSYANVAATIALFVALGGTSYAVAKLPRNSVGSPQLRTNAVGRSEIRKSAVRSNELKDRTIRLSDISADAQRALHGQTGPVGPPGPTFFSTVSSAGELLRGNATGSAQNGLGVRVITFRRSMASCAPAATLTSVPGGVNPVPPPTAHIATGVDSAGRAVVRTWAPNGDPTDYPFNLVVAC